MNFGLASAPMVSLSFMNRAYNKQFDEFSFSSLGITVMHCRKLESHCLNLGFALYSGVGHLLNDSYLNVKLERMIFYLNKARWVPT